MNYRPLVLLALLWLTPRCTFAQENPHQFSHDLWEGLLNRFVHLENSGRASRVDYAALKGERNELRAYLDSIATVTREDFDHWPLNEQLAFLINAYNAWTVELILSEYPGIVSIRDLSLIHI